MQHEKSCGAIVYRKSHGNTEILLIKHINSGHWSFPKGHMENGETEIETAIREIKEERQMIRYNTCMAQGVSEKDAALAFQL